MEREGGEVGVEREGTRGQGGHGCDHFGCNCTFITLC